MIGRLVGILSGMTEPAKILVVQPSWVGDAVMATPTLRALRELYPGAHQLPAAPLRQAGLHRDAVGGPADHLSHRQDAGEGRQGDLRPGGPLGSAKFDLAVLLPNRSSRRCVCKMAGIERIVGYERDGRGFLLSDKLLPVKERGKFVPTPIVKYYLGIAQYLGLDQPRPAAATVRHRAETARGADVLARAGLDPDTGSPGAAAAGRRWSLLNPGAQYGAAKCWLAEYFAELADRLIDELGATVLLSAARRSGAIVEAIKRHMKHAAVDLSSKG